MRIRVKVCGITSAADARAVADCGVDAIGLIFWGGSPRGVEPGAAASIARDLPPFVTRVGVFVNESPERMAAIAAQVGLDWVQLHGEESPEICRRSPRPWYKAFRVGPGFDAAELSCYEAPVHLLDASHPTLRGGSGKAADREAAAAAARRHPVILSGGLGPENVVEAIRTVRPVAVDLNSGVETGPGRKDAGKVARVMARLRDGGFH